MLYKFLRRIALISEPFCYRTPILIKGMIQVQEIYEYLARSENRSVDQALLLAWRRAEEPYRTALLETLLDRGISAATLELIEQYHQLPSQTQEVLAKRVGSLYGGLYHGARSNETQIRLNTLTIIRRGGYLPLVEVVSSMLRDRDRQVSQLAGDVLLSLSKELDDPLSKRHSPKVDPRHKRLLLSALNKALDDFKVHHQVAAILAAMQAVAANQPSFWRDRLENYHIIGKNIRQILLTYDRPEVVSFCVSALAHSSLRVTAARAIATHQRADYLARLALESSRQLNKTILQGLKIVRQPRWLIPERFRPERMTPRAQQALVSLVRRLQVTDSDKALYLSTVAEKANFAAGLKAIVALTRMDEAIAKKSLERLVRSDSESTAVMAALQMRKKNWPQFHRIMLEQFSLGSGKLHEMAQQYLQEMAFDRYWEIFDRLPAASQLAAGRAVYKIDPQAHARWRQKARHISAAQRLRAIRWARLLGCVDEYVDEFIELAQDRDHKVRSCATAALADSRQKPKVIITQLLTALSDEDNRVRANAIEALERTATRETSTEISRFVWDENNRVRANAIKALLHWKVASAQQAIDEMLADARPQHRTSAQWVADHLPCATAVAAVQT